MGGLIRLTRGLIGAALLATATAACGGGRTGPGPLLTIFDRLISRYS
jgi:hypothetical protein